MNTSRCRILDKVWDANKPTGKEFVQATNNIAIDHWSKYPTGNEDDITTILAYAHAAPLRRVRNAQSVIKIISKLPSKRKENNTFVVHHGDDLYIHNSVMCIKMPGMGDQCMDADESHVPDAVVNMMNKDVIEQKTAPEWSEYYYYFSNVAINKMVYAMKATKDGANGGSISKEIWDGLRAISQYNNQPVFKGLIEDTNNMVFDLILPEDKFTVAVSRIKP